MISEGTEPVGSASVEPGSPVRLIVDFDRSTPPVGLLRNGDTQFAFAGWMELLASIESALADSDRSGAASSTP